MKHAEQLIGSPAEHSILVRPKGGAKAVFTAGVSSAVAGSAVRAAADVATSSGDGGGSGLEAGASTIGCVALTSDEIVVLQGKQGMLGPKATGVAGRLPRARVRAAELGSGKLSSPLSVTLDDGTAWDFEVPRSDVKKARALVAALTSS